MFKRAEIDSNDAFDAGGIRFDVLEPFKRLDVSYKGKVVMLDDPLQMGDPKKAFTENPYEACEIKIEYSGVSDMFGGKPEEPHRTEEHTSGLQSVMRISYAVFCLQKLISPTLVLVLVL